MKPFFSIVTPTLQRESLITTCRSVTEQSFVGWEHIVMVDQAEFNFDLVRQILHPNRRVMKCEKAHIDGGNTCRHKAWKYTRGEFLIYLDDDNVFADSNVLRDIASVLEFSSSPVDSYPQWAIFPIDRLGLRFYTDPPKSCHIDTLNLVLRREIAQWPDTNAYGSDGVLVDDLMARGVPYAAFPDFRPIGVIPKISFCQ